MPVQPTYPGVYIQEVPSGVRTIAGVSTSIALFIGRTNRGPMNEPIRCFTYTDFERIFSLDTSQGDMARTVRLFFLNGGTDCYVMRIADSSAAPATVILQNETGVDTLELQARSPGLIGNNIRVQVTYNGLQPESTFNLEVFRWNTNGNGQQIQADNERWTRLSMNPSHSKYVQTFINQNSKLIQVTDQGIGPSASSLSISGRPVNSRTDTIFRDQWQTLIGSSVTTNHFRISVDGRTFTEVDLSTITFGTPPLDTVANVRANLGTEIQNIINGALPAGVSITTDFIAGPTGPVGDDNETTTLLRIVSDNGDVLIEPSSLNDSAQSLMLGTAQGGIEVSQFAAARPAPNGIVLTVDSSITNLIDFGGREQIAFQILNIGGTAIDMTNTLQTVAGAGSRMYQDGIGSSGNGNNNGIREKLSLIASAINSHRNSIPSFSWKAEVWGNRLAILPISGSDNMSTTFTTSGANGDNIGGFFNTNVRYYTLGTGGTGSFQTAAVDGNNGNAPQLGDYRNAFAIVDQEVDLFNLMILPTDASHNEATTNSLWGTASAFCSEKRAFLLIDPPSSWSNVNEAIDLTTGINSLRLGLENDHSAIFFPRITVRENGLNVNIGPSGAIAGLMARIDSTRGIWKAAAGTEANIRGINGLEYRFSDRENGAMNPQGINILRVFPNGIVNWGARTMDGADDFSSDWKYIPVRRTALFIKESLYRGLKWTVFEPNDEPLWAQIRLNVGAFMHNLFRQGAFQGQTKKEAYFVKCDSETTTQNDINLGIVNVWVGFAPLKPAEFVIISLEQMAGQIQI